MIKSPHLSLVNDIAKEINESAHEDEARALDILNPHNIKPIGKVVCVGRSYAAHATELGNAVPTRPILFIKPGSSVISTDDVVPSTVTDSLRNKTYSVHYETELCLLIGRSLKSASVDEVKNTAGLIDAVTLGLDLTLRDLQTELKENGHPWERAKCFDGSCVLGPWIHPTKFGDFTRTKFQLLINDTLVQDGDTSLMLFPIYQLISEISHAFSLQKGDVIMTGTPSGVGMLHSGDKLTLKLGGHTWQTHSK